MSYSSRSTLNTSSFGWLSHVWSLHISVHLRPLASQEQSGSLHVRTRLHASSCNTASGAGERTLHPIYNKLAIVICCTSMTSWARHNETTLQTSPRDGSLVVSTKDMHEEAVFTRWHLARFYLSTSGTEDLIAQLIDCTSAC